MEDAVSEKRKAFAAAHRSDKYRQAYISASRRSSVIAKAKAKAWQATCSSHSLKANPKPVYYYLRSVAGSSSTSSSPNFPNSSSPKESASVFADHLRPHFSVSQPKPCVAEHEATFPNSIESRALRSLTYPFAHLSPPLNFFRLPLISPRPLSLALTKLPVPC